MDNHHVDGVGRFSMLAQGALEEVPSDINVGVRISENEGKEKYNYIITGDR
jgi:hypothetical protein